MSMTNKPVEPSMEEILASIRKIIAEEPIGTRPDPINHHPAKASPRLDTPQKRSLEQEALAIDDVLDMAGGAGRSPGAGARAAAPDDVAGSASNSSKSPAAQNVPPIDVKATGNGAARTEKPAPAALERSTDMSGHKADLDTPPERAEARSVDAALTEAQKKVERHFGALPEPAERPAPLGLRSIRDPLRDMKPASGLMNRVAAMQAALTDPAVDKVRGGNGAAGATTTAPSTAAKEATPSVKTDSTAATTVPQTKSATPAASATQTEVAKPAAVQAKTSLEDAVAEMLRPMLNTWLEANLPRIVEQVVREHVAKTPLPGKDKPAS